MPVVTHLGVALIPVFVFLLVLVLMDSFKLVRPGTVVVAIGMGAGVALVCLLLHGWMLLAGVPSPAIRYYVAPLTEETLKAAFIVLLIARRRVGFLVDAAVQGFAVGAGFALVENIDYFNSVSNQTMLLWIVRGLGTAILHGSTTSIFAMLAKSMSDRYPDSVVRGWLPALTVAVVAHAAFNNAPFSPIAKVLLVLPSCPRWHSMCSSEANGPRGSGWGPGSTWTSSCWSSSARRISARRVSVRYLHQLKARFTGPIVADMFCLLRIELELSVRAKAMLLARQAGLRVPVDDDLYASLAELELPAVLDRRDWPAGVEAAAGDERSRRVAPVSAEGVGEKVSRGGSRTAPTSADQSLLVPIGS